MKSSKEDLRKRGFAEKADTDKYNTYTKEQLYQLLDSRTAAERTIAVILLRTRCGYNDDEYLKILLQRLTKEKALYTKIEICNTLEAGNEKAALMMCNYLGRIGNNQHKTISDAVSKKKCYPLQRDIIARTLSRMDKSLCPVLLSQLDSGDRTKISELVDAIGYMIFYNKELAKLSNFMKIKETFERFGDDELIVWKIALCCSAFPSEESKALLKHIGENYPDTTIQKEVERSLSFIG